MVVILELNPPDINHDFSNRKCNSSINLLAVASPDRSFSYIFVGYPGSVHDARVFQNSALNRICINNPCQLLPNSDFHIIGDSTFPCTPYLIPGFKRSFAKTEKLKSFNYKLSRSRIVIEHSFGCLKNL